MKKLLKTITIITILAVAGAIPAALSYADKADTGSVSVIFTHDMHSHLDEFAKLKTAMDDVKADYPDSFVLDAGDFAMGTPYQVTFSQQASEMKMMDYLGYEATTLGNHEFDYRALGLAGMFDAAKGVNVQMVMANIDWEATLADEELKADAQVLKDAYDAFGVKEYTVVEHQGAKVALFGLMGKNAVDYAPESGLLFKDAIEAATETVEKIKAEEDVDMIICLSHCGTIENEDDVMEETEDYLLAEAVPDIDLIVSGHTHTVLEEAVQVGDTYIVSCGAYNAYMGHAVLDKNDNGRYTLASYELVALDENVAEDAAVVAELKKYRALADEEYFSQYGFSWEQVIANNNVEFTPAEELGIVQGEEPLGNLITDSYKYALEQAGEEADITVVPLGVIRGSFDKGEITVADAFNVSSLGYGKDGLSGYPLVKAYLTGKELKAVAEVDASVSMLMNVARLYCNGLEYSYNPNRLIMNRAVDVKINDGTEIKDVENDKMYSVVADLYSCQMLGTVKDQSFGLLKIEPKDENGDPITNYEDHIIYDGEKELKAWYALASYIDSFEGDQVPEYYGEAQGRKVEIDSKNPVELLKQPNKIAAIVVAVVVLLVLVIVGIVLLIRKLIRRKRTR
ncbi:MAG: bifunctional UDP-sugar hydrolase/5'-nucleotidase [Bacillota bacterium]|nr:bifunctional UDP-sugar hydrolase/5'-nucleotidase [Bacillota bacterium]